MDDRPRFDVIGDVHGCLDELLALLAMLGYRVERNEDGHSGVTPPVGRTAVFLGDLVNRGPEISGVLRLTMDMVASGAALGVRGNHDTYLLRRLQGVDVLRAFGSAYSKAVETSHLHISPRGVDFRHEVEAFLESLPSYLKLDGGRLVVAHAGLPLKYQQRDSDEGREFAVFGPTAADATPWPQGYKGDALVIYGHYARPEVRRSKNAIGIDTGCLYGGHLTAVRYPALEVVQVRANRAYHESSKFKDRAKARA